MFDIPAYLENALAHNTLPQAILFIGSGGEAYAKNLALTLLQTDLERIESENHPDFHKLSPEGKSGIHGIESIRKLIDQVYSAPYEAARKVFLIYNAERMQTAAANALLKTLEEPLLDTTLILLADDARQMLPTILSRCTQLELQSLSPEQSIDFTKLSEEIEKIEALEDPILQSRRGEELLGALMMWARDAHARKLGVSEERLFFPKAPLPNKLPSLEKLEAALEKARLGFQRNIKLSACMEQVLFLF